jgi:hypothetical protein
MTFVSPHSSASSGSGAPPLTPVAAWWPAQYLNRSLAWLMFAAVFVFAVPFILFYRLILYHFYIRGGFLLDTGLLASLMWHNTGALLMPASMGGQSFFRHHVAPVLWLASAISDLLPLTMPRLFACFIGFSQGLLALPVFWLLTSGYGMRRGRELLLAAAVSTAFAFNGLALAIVRFPHFETFAVACLLFFFVALVLERRTVAIVSLAFALATREDIGLHAFGFLSIWMCLNWVRGAPWRESVPLAQFAAAALLYSTVVLSVQHWVFPADSSFVRIYLGEPPLAHLTAGLIAGRLANWLWLHSAIFLPAVVTIVWAARARTPLIAAGFIACVPWALLQLLAVSKLAGLMVAYYAFPFLIAIAWPLIAGRIVGQRDLITSTRLQPAFFLASLIALSLLPVGQDWDPGQVNLPEGFLRFPSAEQQRLTDQAVASIAGRPELGQLAVVESVAALAPSLFAHDEIIGWSTAPPNTVVYFADGFDNERLPVVAGLPGHYAVPGTEIRIVTDRSEQTLRDLGIPH